MRFVNSGEVGGETMADRQLSEGFVHELIQAQEGLYVLILAIVRDPDEASEVLQNTNVVLCNKAGEFDQIHSFRAWAAKIAQFEVLAHRKRKQRDRHLFDDDLVALLAQEGAELVADVAERARALRSCLAELPASQRALVIERYGPEGSIQKIVEQSGRPAGSIRQTLFRIRGALMQCIQRRLAREQYS